MHYKELLDEIRKVILKHASPVRIYLYGSRATGDAGETSDIDIATTTRSVRDIPS